MIDAFTRYVWATTSNTTTEFNFVNLIQVKQIGIDNEIEQISLSTRNFVKRKFEQFLKTPCVRTNRSDKGTQTIKL